MTRLAAIVRVLHDREPIPSMVMVDAQTVQGGRYGPTFHEAGGRGGRTIGTKRTLLVEILGLPVAAGACSARPHDVVAARELLRDRLPDLAGCGRSSATAPTAASRGSPSASTSRSTSRRRHRASAASSRSGRSIKDRARVRPARPLAAPVALLRGHRASARAWLEVASVGYLAWRAVA